MTVDVPRLRRAAGLAEEVGELVGVEPDELRRLLDEVEALKRVLTAWGLGQVDEMQREMLAAFLGMFGRAPGPEPNVGWPLRPGATR